MFEYRAEVVRVVDGDTYDMEVDLGFNVKMFMRIRLKDVDTPETWRPKTKAENSHGEKATKFVRKLLAESNNKVIIRTYKAGASIYGRYTADVILLNYLGVGLNYSLAKVLKEYNLVKREDYKD